MRNSVCFHMDEPKNALKKNGPSRPSPRRNKTTTNHYHNNSQHIDYNPFVKTARFLQKCIEGIFGLTSKFGSNLVIFRNKELEGYESSNSSHDITKETH
jgi:hypothetical protein